MLKTIDKVITVSSSKLNVVAGTALTVMMVLVFLNVLLRMVWEPILGTYEFTGFLASLTVSFSIAHCAVQKGHVAVTLFVDRLSSRTQAMCDAIVGAIGTVLFITLGWQGLKYAMNIYAKGEVAGTTELPFYPFIFGMGFGLLMLALVNLVDFLKALKGIVKR